MKKIAELFEGIMSAECITENADMSKFVTFRAGGHADLLLEPENVNQLKEILKIINREKLKFFLMGNGSNLLVKDGGFRGVIVKIAGQGFNSVDIKPDGVTVTAGGGVLMSSFARFLAKNNLSGFEFAAGIPGTIGGAVFMNAGAYGGEIKDVLVSAKLLAKDGSREFQLSNEELLLTYRHSMLHDTGDVVIEATFQFEKGVQAEIEAKMKEFNTQRREKQPINFPSAGSTFKRPEGYIAAKLIQDADLKGYAVGGAEVSQKHSGFVINKGGATATDIIKVMKHCSDEVEKQFGVILEPEVRILGEDE